MKGAAEAFRREIKKEEAIVPLQNGKSGIVFRYCSLRLLMARPTFLVTSGDDALYKSILIPYSVLTPILNSIHINS